MGDKPFCRRSGFCALLLVLGAVVGCPQTGGFKPSSDAADGSDETADTSTETGETGTSDEGDGTCSEIAWYADCDGDGYAPESAPSTQSCSKPASPPEDCSASEAAWTRKKPASDDGTVDCDDTDSEIHPEAEEKCDGIDNDCDGQVDGLEHQCPVVSLFGTSESDRVNDAVAVGGGDIVVAGSTAGDLGGETNDGNGDGFVATISRGESPRDVRLGGTSSRDSVEAVATDSSGAVYIAGNTEGTFSAAPNQGSDDVYVAKFVDGNRQWIEMLGSPSVDDVRGLATGPFGGIYAVGFTGGAIGDAQHRGSFDSFVAKYESDGTLRWVKSYGSPKHDSFFDVAIDENGKLYVAGMSSGTIDGNSGAGGLDAILTKIKPNGASQWTSFLGSSAGDGAHAVELGPEGEVHLVGTANKSVEGKPHLAGTDGFWALYDRSGNRQGLQMLQSEGEDSIRDLEVDSEGGIYIGAWTDGKLFDIATVAGRDAVAAKFELNGTSLERVWTSRLSSPGQDEITRVEVTEEGRPFVFGFSDGNLEGATNQGEDDAFIAW